MHGPRLRSGLRKLAVRLRNPHATVRFGRHTYLGPGFTFRAPDGGTLIVGEAVEFRRDVRIEVGSGATVRIGDASHFTYGVVIQCGGSIEIGRRCIFAHAVTIVDGNHRFREPDVPVLAQGYDLRPLVIGDDVGVMSKATVIASLGAHSFVGANAVVTRDVPDHALAVGVPAAVIERYGP